MGYQRVIAIQESNAVLGTNPLQISVEVVIRI